MGVGVKVQLCTVEFTSTDSIPKLTSPLDQLWMLGPFLLLGVGIGGNRAKPPEREAKMGVLLNV